MVNVGMYALNYKYKTSQSDSLPIARCLKIELKSITVFCTVIILRGLAVFGLQCSKVYD